VRGEVTALFDRGDCGAAAAVAAAARDRMSAGPAKEAMRVLAVIAEGYSLWDRFAHAKAEDLLRRAAAQRHLLRPLFVESQVDRMGERMTADAAWCGRVAALRKEPSGDLLRDLLGNARRRMVEGRHDDAVARAYRAVEVYAQWRLAGHGIRTAAVGVEQLPASLRAEWGGRAAGGVVRVGLQESYRLLGALGDDALGRLEALRLSTDGEGKGGGLLLKRNQSILAHGFEPVKAEDAEALVAVAVSLAQLREEELPSFPRMG
jgi:CRISPR-associated protein (TIGR02710 family)